MRRPRWVRFSLAGLVGLVSLAALGAAALANSSSLWASLMFSAVVAMLMVGGLLILFRRGRTRAFWIGFVMFGSVYLALVFGPWLADNIGPHLLTTQMLRFVHRKLPPAGPPHDASPLRREVELINYDVAYADYNYDGAADVVFVESLGISSPPVDTIRRPLRRLRTVSRPAATLRPWDPVRRIGHSWLAVFVALAGGLVGRALFDSQAREQKGATPSNLR